MCLLRCLQLRKCTLALFFGCRAYLLGALGFGKPRTWEIARKGKVSKRLGVSAKGRLNLESKGLPRVFATNQNLFCTGATSFCTSARGILLAGSKRPVAPSPNHFLEFPFLRQFPRSVASQRWFVYVYIHTYIYISFFTHIFTCMHMQLATPSATAKEPWHAF